MISTRVGSLLLAQMALAPFLLVLLVQKGMMALAPFLLVLLVQKGMMALDTLTKV